MGAVEIGDDWSGQVMAGDCSSNSSYDADQCEAMQSRMQLFPLWPVNMSCTAAALPSNCTGCRTMNTY